MAIELGKQYTPDDCFMAKARLHQSIYRRDILKVDCEIYGNMLQEQDGVKLLNYYQHLGVREILRQRYPRYSKSRDANMLRSEHIPFNLFGPLVSRRDVAIQTLNRALNGDIHELIRVQIEYAPEPKQKYLHDGTSFDAYIEYLNGKNLRCGYGIEVKYTEHEYPIGAREKENINKEDSKYWTVTAGSGVFDSEKIRNLASDKIRQIWRNHLLGISMIQNNDLDYFQTVTIYPHGNSHFHHVLPEYQSLLTSQGKNQMIGCTLERFIDAIDGEEEILEWKRFLQERYIVSE